VQSHIPSLPKIRRDVINGCQCQKNLSWKLGGQHHRYGTTLPPDSYRHILDKDIIIIIMVEFTLDPASTAIVFIEYQNEFTTPGGKLHDAVKECMEKTNSKSRMMPTLDIDVGFYATLYVGSSLSQRGNIAHAYFHISSLLFSCSFFEFHSFASFLCCGLD
jgi:hypothetical protein